MFLRCASANSVSFIWAGAFHSTKSFFPMDSLSLISLGLAALLLGCTTTNAPSPEQQVISTEAAPEAIGPYSQAIQVGNTIYCSGQVGIDPKTGDLVEGGIEAETRQALENLEAVLNEAGASVGDVTQVQVFLTDLEEYDAMNEVYRNYFEEAPPARAAVEASGLPAGARVEILVTAQK